MDSPDIRRFAVRKLITDDTILIALSSHLQSPTVKVVVDSHSKREEGFLSLRPILNYLGLEIHKLASLSSLFLL
jgi:hypothetical protein